MSIASGGASIYPQCVQIVDALSYSTNLQLVLVLAGSSACFVDNPGVRETATRPTGSDTSASSSSGSTLTGGTTSSTTALQSTSNATTDSGSTTGSGSTSRASTSTSDTTSTGESTSTTTGCTRQHWYIDDDKDGFGNPLAVTMACEPPPGYVDNPDDCNDKDEKINPDIAELCDGVDNNCNNLIDEWSAINLSCQGCSMTALGASVYHICTQQSTFDEAREICQNRDSDLVIIETIGESKSISMLVQGLQPLWLGLSDTAVEGSFVWINGSALVESQAPWAPGEPNNANNAEDCVLQNPLFANTWNDRSCLFTATPLCESPLP